MKGKQLYILGGLVLCAILLLGFSNSDEQDEHVSETAKIALREVGNQLLLTYQDSTSRVLPILPLSSSKYQISFESELSFLPDELVAITDSVLTKAQLQDHYRVQVIQCDDQQVAYSYEIDQSQEHTIIPCSGRRLNKNCYIIEVRFIKSTSTFIQDKAPIAIVLTGIFLFVVARFREPSSPVGRSEKKPTHQSSSSEEIPIGSYTFYPKQLKLEHQGKDIPLSNKESELLSLFAASPNQVIKRDELTKKVWEDHGVIVGRSLDTYISKLRKKLKADPSLKITNVHGVGYKLEV